ncbi:MAG: rhodanese-like domain-containing protein [Pseudomonadota bacterium]
MTLPDLFHIAFYRFVRVADPAQVAVVVRELGDGLRGSVLVAAEGINGTLAGPGAELDRFERGLRGDARLAGLFDGLQCRRTTCAVTPFGRLAVHVRAEVLPLGVPGVDAVGRRGTQLDPAQWRALLDTPGAVVIDNRNAFEFRLGRFRGAVDPQVGNFRDLPAYVAAHAAAWKAEGRPVAMYCTGGIRCEKTAAWLADEFGLEVAQLEGGILRYLAEVPDAQRDWQGECFVFDNRLSLDAALRPGRATLADVYRSDVPDEAWRLERARRLATAGTA